MLTLLVLAYNLAMVTCFVAFLFLVREGLRQQSRPPTPWQPPAMTQADFRSIVEPIINRGLLAKGDKK